MLNPAHPNTQSVQERAFIIQISNRQSLQAKTDRWRAPDGKGLFGYTRNPDTYAEVIPYDKLLLDAQARNAIFFDKLGLNG
jgi:hypothetical protein